jgi:hypothetical protein
MAEYEGGEDYEPKEGDTSHEYHAQVRDEYLMDIEFARDNSDLALDDLRFWAADQWDERVREWRESSQRPCLTFDHISQHIRQVTGDIRLNKPGIKVLPVDDGADPQGARLRSGLIRGIEQQSQATHAYVIGGSHATACGIGHWRIETDYSHPMSFDLDIRITPIYNPLSVVWDRTAKHPARIDAKHCYVLTKYTKGAFRERWPKADMSTFEGDVASEWRENWVIDDQIVVAEYWCKKESELELWQLADGSVIAPDHLDEEERDRLMDLHAKLVTAQGGRREPEKRKTTIARVERRLMSGAEFLPDENGDLVYTWYTDDIPIVAVTGEEIHAGEELFRRGMVRTAKDPQRMINALGTSAVETYTTSPRPPWIATKKQIAGHEKFWETANIENHSVLPYNIDQNAPPPTRSQPPQLDGAALQLKAESKLDLEAATGLSAAGSLGQEGLEISGKAILARERQGDVGTFIFLDNLALSIGATGRQLLKLIPKIYDGERVVRILGEDEVEEITRVNEMDQNDDVLNDLTSGRYDYTVQTGKSFSTRRQETAEFMLEAMKINPMDMPLIAPELFKSLDSPGAEKLAEYYRKKLIGMGLEEPDPDKGEQPPGPPPPSPEMVEAETNRAETMADIEKTKAETRGKELENAQAALELAMKNGSMQQMVKQAAGEALQAFINRQNGQGF